MRLLQLDFCACLAPFRQQSPLLDELHLTLIRHILHDDEVQQTVMTSPDARDYILCDLRLLASTTYGEIIRRYVESDVRRVGADYSQVTFWL